MKLRMVVLLGLLLFAAADHPPPAEASRPAAGVRMVREEMAAAGGGLIAWGEWTITAYCPCRVCCGKWADYKGGGWTASGVRARAGETVAVDPAVVPIGSRVWVEGVGWRVAQDTGSAVGGRHVDVYMDTHDEAARWGRRRRMVLVMGEG